MVLTAFRRLVARVGALVGRARLDRDFRLELASHLAMLTEDNIARGMAPEEARRAALIRVGGATSLLEQHRAERGLPSLDSFLRDLRYAMRTLLRYPGVAGLATLTLAIGIGASTAIFSVVDTVLIRPLPFPDADRLAMVWEAAPALGYPKTDASAANYLDWAQQSDVFADLAAYYGDAFNLTGHDRPQRLDGVPVTPNLFSLLGVEPFLGRTFSPADGAPGAGGVAILSHALWQRRFGGDASIVGRAILLNERPHVVIGVMPKGFQFPREDTQLWTPVAFSAAAVAPSRGSHFLRVVGRLKSGRTWRDAQTEFDTIAARLAAAYPKTNSAYGALVVPLHEQFVGATRSSLWFLQAAALLLLLVACGNVAGLLITRAMRRRPEIALRSALGASRGQIVRQLVVEGLTLSALSAVAGTLVALATVRLLDMLIPAALRGAVAPALNWRVLAFTTATAIVSGVVFGLAPLRALAISDLTRHFAGRGTEQPRDPTRAVLVAAQIAVAVVVVASAGLLVRTILNLQRVDPGFRSENILTARLEPASRGEGALERRKRFYRDVLERVHALPGVVSAGFTTFLPYTNFGGSSSLLLEDRQDIPDDATYAYRREVTPDYLPTIGVRLLAGRGLTEEDDAAHPLVAVVNEYIANLLGGEAVGKRIKLGSVDGPWITIVGVVANIREEGLDAPAQRGAVYSPVAQSRALWYFNPRDLAIRVSGDPASYIAALERAVWSVDKDQAISNVRIMQALVDGQIRARKSQATLVTVFAALVVVVAALGVFGLMSFVVTARMQEFGVRLALGADRTRLAAFVARQGLLWLAAGTMIGLAITFAVTRTFAGLLYGVRPLDPLTLMSAAALLGLVACVSSLVPVYRATRIDPLTALRYE